MPQEQKIEERQEVTNSVVDNNVIQSVTVLHKDIDTGEWFPVSRITASINKTVEEFKAAMADLKQNAEAEFAEAIRRFDAAIQEVDVVDKNAKTEKIVGE